MSGQNGHCSIIPILLLMADFVPVVSVQLTNLGLKYTSRPVSLPFLATLVALESTIGVYWVGYIKLFKVSLRSCTLSLEILSSSSCATSNR